MYTLLPNILRIKNILCFICFMELAVYITIRKSKRKHRHRRIKR